MSRVSTIPITLDPSIYAPQPPVRSAIDTERRRPGSVTLAPTVYDPNASRNRSTTDQRRPSRSKDLPAIPMPSRPPTRSQPRRHDEGMRRPRRDMDRRARGQPASGRTHSEPPSRMGTFYSDVEESERRAFSNPPSRKATMNTAPRGRPTIVQENPPPRRPSVPTSKPGTALPRGATPESKAPPPGPLSRAATLVEEPASSGPASGSATLVEEPLPSFNPHSRGNALQTRYMRMLLSLDKIPRLHNILASFFGWIMLAGFIVLPGTFTSLAKLGSNNAVKATPGASDVLNSVQSVPLLVVAAVCCGIGYLGNLWLSIRWRNNYVWLLNKLYLPGTLNALAGFISTLTNIYAQQNGSWNVSATVAVVVESVTLVAYLVLFILYNNWLLAKVKEEHYQELEGGFDSSTFKGKMEKIAKKPSFAPGSIV